VALMRTEVSEERSASIIRVTRMGELTSITGFGNWMSSVHGRWEVHELRCALSKEPNRVGVSLSSPEVIEVSSF
jgi:hypothetical protein